MPNRKRAAASRLLRIGCKIVGLGPSGWILLVRVQSALREAVRLLETRAQGDLIRELSAPAEGAPAAREEDRERVEEVGLAIDRVARFGFGQPRCLARSIAFQKLLVDEGIPGAKIRVGVRMRQSEFQAHAWLEWDGEVVGEDPDYVKSFRQLPDFPGGDAPLAWAR